jgi:quinol monooxygenase YgiN
MISVAVTPTLAVILEGSPGEKDMYGLIVKLTTSPGMREEMIRILKESAVDMPGCLNYIVALDSEDQNTLWVTEVWDSAANHDASLSLPAVKNAVPQAKQIVTHFEKIAVTKPVWGTGAQSAHDQ